MSSLSLSFSSRRAAIVLSFSDILLGCFVPPTWATEVYANSSVEGVEDNLIQVKTNDILMNVLR